MIDSYILREADDKIINFEMEMLDKYVNIISPYVCVFGKLGYDLRIGLGWFNFVQKIWSDKRLPLRNGYECHIYCWVEKDGEEVRIKSNSEEVDYYPLITSWMISSVSRRFHKLRISTYTDINDIVVEIEELLLRLP